MENGILVFSPVIVSVITALLKKLNLQAALTSGKRKVVVRVVVALLAYGVVNLTAAIVGNEVDPIATQTFVNAILIFVGSIGVYSLRRK